MKDNPIGIIDSGIGGFTILKEIIKNLPNESLIYLADSKNCPYGNKTEAEIYKLAKRLTQFLITKKVKLIVVACNTITVSCIEKLRKEFPGIPIIGTVPVVKTASELTKTGRIGILSTNKTSKSKYQKALLKKFGQGLKILNLGTDRLVPLIEMGAGPIIRNSLEPTRLAQDARNGYFEFSRTRRSLSEKGLQANFSGDPGSFFSSFADGQSSSHQILKKELKPFTDFKIDVLVLGCTHFPFLKPQIQKTLGKKIRILDSSGAIARQVIRVLDNNRILSEYNKPKYIFYTTGHLQNFKLLSKNYLGEMGRKGRWRKIKK